MYATYYYLENINTPCSCADGYSNDELGSCIPNKCADWTTKHPSDKSGYTPNGLTCGGIARSYSGCVLQSGKQFCTCREGFSGNACEQVLCAHANGNVCSANGYCDKTFNDCICKEGYVGVACEIKLESVNPCNGNGQQTKSYPLPSSDPKTDYQIPETLNLKVEWL